ncbi:jg3606 [Pararge aegeria aegeria]|uniref:Jg3606 protein n=1 Tax=Pararge aegeria aegeria TaxID=348720 RepID=A0A8S4R551_9NEOP|nr:jg3606 [Pararge aegeria aegeria]
MQHWQTKLASRNSPYKPIAAAIHSFAGDNSQVIIKPFNRRAASEALALNRKNLCILVRALTGHCGLNRHMFNLKLQDTDLCRLCKEAAETPLHLICSCPALMHKRSTLLGKYIIQPEDAKLLPATKGLLFLATNACWEI